MNTTTNALPLRPLRYLLLLAMVIIAIAVTVYYYISAGDVAAMQAAREGGPIDFASAMGYFVCAALMVCLGGSHVVRHHWPLIITVTLLGLREMDFDKRFSTYGLFKSATLRAPDVSILEKGITLLVILAVVALFITLIRRYARTLLGSVLRLEAVSLITGFAGAMLIIARALDGAARKLADFGIHLPHHSEVLTTITEEVIELGVPVTLMLAFLAYRRVYLRH
ncbi:hypothetical protein [Gilvimarinus algae]|uniref:Uncharacterized protein n=1 Tax=Gilvimarinus algae TaxID=3058037 RepID=A0ABT8TBP8_9GAMM|nr:hypothetical protein [Gilvimarinus sp. SDUM040014]MDO3381024.1 hypothetical protein [Gilvimarinus sp. SDUM040014]